MISTQIYPFLPRYLFTRHIVTAPPCPSLLPSMPPFFPFLFFDLFPLAPLRFTHFLSHSAPFTENNGVFFYCTLRIGRGSCCLLVEVFIKVFRSFLLFGKFGHSGSARFSCTRTKCTRAKRTPKFLLWSILYAPNNVLR